MRRFLSALASTFALAAAPSGAAAQSVDPPANPPMPGKFELVGHEPLMMRGMNAALAVHKGYAYIGSRTDGTHANAGVFVVDVRDPANPAIVKEMTGGNEALPTQTSRELRIVPDQELLYVLHHQCNELIHRCAAPSNAGVSVLPSNISVYDIAGANAADPKLIHTFEPSAQGPQTPHEFFMWSDPKRSGRVLMYYSDPGGSDAEIVVADFSRVREGQVTEIAKFKPELAGRLHSMSVSHDGRKLFMAGLTGGYGQADASEVADAKKDPVIKQLTPEENAPKWEGPGAHSAVGLPGRNEFVMITDEVYGYAPGLFSDHGCPWGWVRFIDSKRPTNPQVVSEYKLAANQAESCGDVAPDRNSTASFAAHNPTLTEHLALLTWHSHGLQVIDTTNPAAPTGAAEYLPEPLLAVQTEDPLLSSGRDKVVMWSFPHIIDGLVYVVDLRNGLYVLRYKGPYEEEVARVKFLDGASNSGDQGRLEAPKGTPVAKAQTPADPQVGGPAPCLTGIVGNAVGRSLSRFTLGMRVSDAKRRGGPASRETSSALRYCARNGARVGLALRRGKVVFIGTTARGSRAGRFAVGGRGSRRSGVASYTRRGVTYVARMSGGRIRAVGIAAGRVKPINASKYLRSAGV